MTEGEVDFTLTVLGWIAVIVVGIIYAVLSLT